MVEAFTGIAGVSAAVPDEQLHLCLQKCLQGKIYCSDYTVPAHCHAVAVFPAKVEVLHAAAAGVCCI